MWQQAFCLFFCFCMDDTNMVLVLNCNYYRKRGSASYIVREVLSVRERERERERDTERERETEVTSPFSRDWR